MIEDEISSEELHELEEKIIKELDKVFKQVPMDNEDEQEFSKEMVIDVIEDVQLTDQIIDILLEGT